MWKNLTIVKDGEFKISEDTYSVLNGNNVVIKKMYSVKDGVFNLCYERPPSFSEATWDEIINCCQTDNVPRKWDIGDEKTMVIDGEDYLVRIIGKYHDEYIDGGIAPLTFELKDCYSKWAMDSKNEIEDTASYYDINNYNNNITYEKGDFLDSLLKLYTYRDIFNHINDNTSSALSMNDEEVLQFEEYIYSLPIPENEDEMSAQLEVFDMLTVLKTNVGIIDDDYDIGIEKYNVGYSTFENNASDMESEVNVSYDEYNVDENSDAINVINTTYVAKLNSVDYSTLEEAVAVANADTSGEEQVITLINDVAITSNITIANKITIDGDNNYTLTYGEGYASGMFNIGDNGIFTVKNLTIDGGFLGELDSQYLTPETYIYPTNRTNSSTYPLTSTEGVNSQGNIFENNNELYVQNTIIQNFLSIDGDGWGNGLVVKAVDKNTTHTEFNYVTVTNCINSGSGTLFNHNNDNGSYSNSATFVMRNSSVTYTMGGLYGAVIHVRDQSTFITIENTVFDYNCINQNADTVVIYARASNSTVDLTDVKIINSLGGHDVIEVYSGAILTLNETAKGKMLIESVGYHYDDDVYANGAVINGGTITGSNSVSLGGNTYIGTNATIENPKITIGGTSTNEGTLIGDVRASSSSGSLTNTGTITGDITVANTLINSGNITGNIIVSEQGFVEITENSSIYGNIYGDIKINNMIIDVDSANGSYVTMNDDIVTIPSNSTVTLTTIDSNGNEQITSVTGPVVVKDGNFIYITNEPVVKGNNWESCNVRLFMLPTIKSVLPSNISSSIQTVKKTSLLSNDSDELCTLSEKLFILSKSEIFGEEPDEGEQYEYYKEHSATKCMQGVALSYSTRTVAQDDNYGFNAVDENGNIITNPSENPIGISFAFCF